MGKIVITEHVTLDGVVEDFGDATAGSFNSIAARTVRRSSCRSCTTPRRFCSAASPTTSSRNRGHALANALNPLPREQAPPAYRIKAGGPRRHSHRHLPALS